MPSRIAQLEALQLSRLVRGNCAERRSRGYCKGDRAFYMVPVVSPCSHLPVPFASTTKAFTIGALLVGRATTASATAG